MTIDQPHAPTVSCDACRSLFVDEHELHTYDDLKDLHSIRHRIGYDIVTIRRQIIAHWQRRARGGQAIVEFALVFPILLGLLLAILEAGSFGARWIGYAHLADTMTASAAQTGELPAWFATEADRAGCTDASAAILPGTPSRVELRCTYNGIAVNGLVWAVTIDDAIPD